MPSLIPEIDNAPGTHVLVIGVSEYLHFDDGSQPTTNGDLFEMAQLSAAARSASDFAAWILNEREFANSPLHSLRVLLSPAANETVNPDIAALLTGDFSATTDNVRNELVEFRNICSRHKDNVAIVYVAGHGVQLTSSGSLLLLHDCGSNGHAQLLEGALDMVGVHAAFNHPNTAQTQFWFVDACRQKPDVASNFETLGGALSLDEPLGNAESTALFLAATTGTKAYARIGGVTLFNEALLSGLRGGIAVKPESGVSSHWHISTFGLVKHLRPRVKALADAENAEQSVDSIVRIQDSLLHEYLVTPSVNLSIELDPAAAHAGSEGRLTDGDSLTIAQTTDIWPMAQTVDVGIYKLKIDTVDAFLNHSDFLEVEPHLTNQRFDLTP